MLEGSAFGVWTVTLLWAAFTGIGIPWIGMRALAPTLSASDRRVANYRGAEVFVGLGLVWAFWLLGGLSFFVGIAAALRWTGADQLALVGGPIDLALPLVGGAFVFGLIDDVYGSAAEKGFRGHLGALAGGRLTTGGLKLLGIGALSLLGGAHLALAGEWSPVAVLHGSAVAATLALSANTLNLFDLRPGRALKVYALLAALGVGLLVVRTVGGDFAGEPILDAGVVLAFLIGPAVAVWRFDLGEIGMLGDAGANGLGMLAGVLLVTSLPPVGVAVLAVVLAGLNIVSERVSFSTFIERHTVLSWIDGWGRGAGRAAGRRTDG